MKKILILANSSSGLYEFRGELIQRLIEEGYGVCASLPELEYKEKLDKIGCKTKHTPFDRRGINPLKDLDLLRHYISLIKEVRPVCVLTYTIKPNIYGGMVASLLKVPYLANITGLGSALEDGGFVGNAAKTLYRKGLKKARRVFVQNEYNRDFVLKRRIVSQGQIELLSGSGVNLAHFTPLDYPEKPCFLFIARILKEKGIDYYLSVAEKIHKEEGGNVRFIVLGACDKDYEPALKRLMEKGVIEYYGKVPDTRPYLKEAQCQIHPSFYAEGMSNVCLEAAACGRPVITTDHPGCRDTIIDQETG
ncbi:MAG: glycosyltransferase family 4 protein, partial [Lachnospiraceae bacterium]|nr:glycosyltransferase family 4 protein [Lachnospiraceae bacterium]